MPTRWKLYSPLKPDYMGFFYGENRILWRKICWKFLLIRVSGTYQNKPKIFGEKRTDLKEESEGKSRMNHAQIVEKYPFGIDLQHTQMDK